MDSFLVQTSADKRITGQDFGVAQTLLVYWLIGYGVSFGSKTIWHSFLLFLRLILHKIGEIWNEGEAAQAIEDII